LYVSNKLQWAVLDKGFHLTDRRRSIRFILLTVLFLGLSLRSLAVDSLGTSSTSVVRLQLESIAEEVVDKTLFNHDDRIALWVEGEGPQTLAENAFIEALQKRKYTTILNTGSLSEQTLHVFLLKTQSTVRKLNDSSFERETQSTLEARTVTGKEREVHLLGIFHRELKDTAQVFPSTQLPLIPVIEHENLMQKLLTPIIVISGAILMIYLLFTVRS
jgi:hypothetical protein